MSFIDQLTLVHRWRFCTTPPVFSSLVATRISVRGHVSLDVGVDDYMFRYRN